MSDRLGNRSSPQYSYRILSSGRVLPSPTDPLHSGFGRVSLAIARFGCRSDYSESNTIPKTVSAGQPKVRHTHLSHSLSLPYTRDLAWQPKVRHTSLSLSHPCSRDIGLATEVRHSSLTLSSLYRGYRLDNRKCATLHSLSLLQALPPLPSSLLQALPPLSPLFFSLASTMGRHPG